MLAEEQLGYLLIEEGKTDEAIAALGDIVLYERVVTTGARFEETPGQYVAGAAARFAASAPDEEWLGLIAAIERDPDPGRAALGRILRWALGRDRVDDHGHGTACSCSAEH